ncbi:MAG: histone [Halobacteriales archaeon]|nr:histone [Halobacteriales archaeon]
MTVELPYAPVDTLIREVAPGMRVSSGTAEELASRIQDTGASLAVDAAEKAKKDGRKTIRATDFDFEVRDVPKDSLILPVAPVDRIARLRVSNFRVRKEARVALAVHLEDWAKDIAEASAKLARHAGRRTVQREDVEAYFDIYGET